MFDLTGKVALVTGAGQNAGAGIAALLVRQGATVAVNDLVEQRALETARRIKGDSGRAIAAPFDVTDAESVAAGIEALEGRVGPVDILVNNAGVPPGMQLARFREMDPAEWSRYIDLNLYGVLHCTREVIDGMCERGWGRVITISSGAGQTGLSVGVSLYGAGKGGAIAFMRHLALEVARSGVTANTLTLGMMENAAGSGSVDALAEMVPVGRPGRPEDIGAAVVFLASEEAGWLTGQTIGLNGGSLTS